MKIRKLYVLFILGGICVNNSCDGPSSLWANEYISWVENIDNGLRKVKRFRELQYTVQYKPMEYIIALEQKKNEISTSQVRERIEEISGMEYYALRISHIDKISDPMMVDANSKEEYLNRTTYFSFDFQNDIHLVCDNDTIPCGLFQFVNTYGLAPYIHFELGFENNSLNNNESDRIIIIDDKVYGIGTIKLGIDHRNINKVPALKTQY